VPLLLLLLLLRQHITCHACIVAAAHEILVLQAAATHVCSCTCSPGCCMWLRMRRLQS
jgi:hypothetical protein